MTNSRLIRLPTRALVINSLLLPPHRPTRRPEPKNSPLRRGRREIAGSAAQSLIKYVTDGRVAEFTSRKVGVSRARAQAASVVNAVGEVAVRICVAETAVLAASVLVRALVGYCGIAA
jgi:hypothetical protein